MIAEPKKQAINQITKINKPNLIELAHELMSRVIPSLNSSSYNTQVQV